MSAIVFDLNLYHSKVKEIADRVQQIKVLAKELQLLGFDITIDVSENEVENCVKGIMQTCFKN